jgi:hypothetical protein
MARSAYRFCFVLVLSLISVPRIWACSCSRTAPGACSKISDEGILFVGTVVDIENPADERRGANQGGTSRYRFRVDETLNGITAKEVDVYSGRGGGDCSYHFQLGETYFVNPAGTSDHLLATICSDTQPAQGAEALLIELRARRDGKPFASVYGVLRKTQQPYTWTYADGYDRPLPGTTVELKSSERTVTSKTDNNGIFRFYGLPAGTYNFAVVLPAHLELVETIVSEPPPSITVPENACYQQDLDALPIGRIHGRVLGPDGLPLKNADVELFGADRYKENEMGWWEFQDQEKGHFEFNNVSPGRYVVVFHNSNRPDPDMPYPRTFYPGVPDLNSALPITLEEGQQILNADIHLSGGSNTRTIIVKVRWNQSPTPNDVFVFATASDGSQPFAKRVSPGVFEITIFRQARYSIVATQDCGLRWEGNTGKPIGGRETERIQLDGADIRTTEVNLSLQDPSCKPYSIQTK